jgi:hypothetical protein
MSDIKGKECILKASEILATGYTPSIFHHAFDKDGKGLVLVNDPAAVSWNVHGSITRVNGIWLDTSAYDILVTYLSKFGVTKPVAQWLEPAAHNGLVAGSSPAGFLDLPEEKIEYLKEHWTTQTYLELSKNMGVRIGVIQQASKKLCLPRKIPNRIKPHILLGEKGLRHGDRLII